MKLTTTLEMDGERLSLTWQLDPRSFLSPEEGDMHAGLADWFLSAAPQRAAEMTRQLASVLPQARAQFAADCYRRSLVDSSPAAGEES